MKLTDNISSHPFPSLPGYHIIEQLYLGSRTAVYRAIQTATQRPVVIKVLQRKYPSFSELVQFRNQHTIMRCITDENALPMPGIVQPLSLEPVGNSYALVMEDWGGVALERYRQQQSLELADVLKIALQIADILHGLDQHQVVHKDIKPANILIHPETKQIKLIDFSIASLLPKETQDIQSAHVLEGTLAYLAPEQTGRMNRGIDYRADFYALGVTLYQLLTGKLPFESDDPLELIHCHIAKMPLPADKRNPKIPGMVGAIVSKLMAKNAEDRYQSALGLKHDLSQCLTQWQETGAIAPFDLGEQDISDRFLIPEKLYGREREVQTLLQAFDRVADGSSELMLVSGFSGIGKTAVVNEVHKPIVRQRGYFIKGKFDQFNRNVPLSAFVQALRDLMGQLLSESDEQLAQWRAKILASVKDNGQILVEVIPELEQIIGKQLPVSELSGSAAQNRFNRLFQKFIEVFTTADHPLVIFLDDLQWSDPASLQLLKLLMHDQSYLLILGAYRDNEVSPVHPFISTVEEIKQARAIVNTITLSPLAFEDTNHLIADTLNCSVDLAQPLTKLIDGKTQGNPFFTTQFLKALHGEGQISFNSDRRHWECDIVQINTLLLTDDVVEFMAAQLQKLPDKTQQILRLAACIGNQFDLTTLAIVSEQPPTEAATALWKALQEGLILPSSQIYKFFQSETPEQANAENLANPKYRFLHDRIQQAAYSLIPDDQKIATHFTIGRLLEQNSSEEELEEKLFDIVGHLNLGIELITTTIDRQALAQLNLKAGVKARNATAYAAARVYLQKGLGLLEPNCWQHGYELALNLYVLAGEAAYLNGELDEMEELAAIVLRSAQTINDKIKIYEIQIAAQVLQSNVLEAIAIGRHVLGELGIELPTEINEAKIEETLQTLAAQLEGTQIEDLVDMPAMGDPTAQAALEIMGMLFSPIIQGMPALLPWLSAMMVSLSLKFGNTAASITGYGIHGMVLCAFLEDPVAGYAFGKLAIDLLERLEKFNTQKISAVVMCLFGCFIQHSKEPLKATNPMLKAAYNAGMETGDFLHAGFALSGSSSNRFFSGEELHDLLSDLVDYSVALAQVKQYSAQAYLNLGKQAVENLIELVDQPHRLIGDTYDETLMLPKHQQDNDLIAIAQAHIYKLLLAYHFGSYPDALNSIDQAKPCLMAVSASIFVPVFHFYAALTYLAIFPSQPEVEQNKILLQVQSHKAILRQWSDNAPMNHLHKWYLVEAEEHRVLGKRVEASECYDKAIFLSKKNQFLNEEALANELAARFYLDWDKLRLAGEYMIDAYYAYTRWGAKAKVIDLEDRYPQLLAPILQQDRSPLLTNETIFALNSSTSTGLSTSTGHISDILDFKAILKASQALSSEIELQKLLSALLSIIIENAGGNKCVLMLERDNRILVKGMIVEGSEPIVLQRIPVEESQSVPLSLIYKVRRNQQTVVIIDAIADPALVNDPYVIRCQPKSVLCSPILHQGKLKGILYLENNLATGAFTNDRVELLNSLCAQAAISLENARLYEQAQTYVQQLEQSQLQIVQSEKMASLGNLVAGIAHEINNPIGFLKGSISNAKEYVQDLLEHLALYQQHYPKDVETIQDNAEDIDLEFLIEDLPQLLESMENATDRISNISTSLRTFSRADTDRKISANLHEGIDSTLLILKYRLKASASRPAIEILQNYGEIPEVLCFPGQLNQVFINILANAIDAFDEMTQTQSFEAIKASSPQIAITTATAEEQVEIRIADNGKGMPEEVQQKIFDHLFTTKGVGKGTGLGLAIARQIVEEKHGGSLQVWSELDKGTEFCIRLPILENSD
ncbi:MAG: trifunctional serine/threonine-protein kinase/ATP-binding protein/sensor histidine kinase [Cyanobacteria bacterium]|nr:trifunctional serine/threonine-protein kinase/ATP-binding protein/sensor histidine kinase [Cyanobacteriota bacterium]